MADQVSYVNDEGVRVYAGYEDFGDGKLLYTQKETGGAAVRVPADSPDADALRAAHPELAALDEADAAPQQEAASAPESAPAPAAWQQPPGSF